MKRQYIEIEQKKKEFRSRSLMPRDLTDSPPINKFLVCSKLQQKTTNLSQFSKGSKSR